MIRILSLAAALSAAAATPAAAGSWSFGVGIGFGDPVYVELAPRYDSYRYYSYEPPVVYERVPPPLYSQGAPVAVAPDGRPVLHMESADDVVASLSGAGYREFGPVYMRRHFYTVTAVDPNGDLVELEISIFTGEIAMTTVLETRGGLPMELPNGALTPAMPPAALAETAPPSPPVVGTPGPNPLVVY